jgi:hypothetical protein
MKSPRKIVEKAAIAVKKRYLPPDRNDAARLLHLLRNVPQHRPDIDEWHRETASLIRSLITARISSDDLAAILAGLAAYKATGVTPEQTQHSLIQGYCNTNGLLQELFHAVLFRDAKPAPKIPASEYFGTVDEKTVSGILAEMRDSGYCVLPFGLPERVVEDLKTHSLTLSYKLREPFSKDAPKLIKTIDPSQPKSVSAYAVTEDVMGSPQFLKLMDDPLMVYLASACMQAAVGPIDATLWYSFPSPSQTASSESAQLFHFDLDTLKWLKVFYYLGDVGPENGPHTYVKGTHVPGAKDPSLLTMGYARITDEQIDAAHPGKKTTITGPAGTVILADTRCFHKGTPLKAGHRLIFSPIYAPSRAGYYFGAAKS